MIPFYLDKYPTIPRPPFEAYQRGTIDVRHLMMIRAVLAVTTFDFALEIGCFEGYSTLALLDAQDSGSVYNVSVCDVDYRPHLRAIFEGRPHARFHHGSSLDVLSEMIGKQIRQDFVFVDGAHDRRTVEMETDLLLQMQPLVVMAHDTNSEAVGLAGCDGPPFLKAAFQYSPDYICLEDNRKRPGETTEKGLFCAVRSVNLLKLIRGVFEAYGTVPINPKYLPFQ